MATSTVTEAVLSPILARDPAGPRITYYDDSTGERIELSAITLANWSAKTGNFLRDELGLAPGGRVLVRLPAHWQTAAVLLGVWWAGGEVILGGDGADIALVTADGVDDDGGAAEVVALSLDPFGTPAANLPIGVTDYATSVRVHGDQFAPSGSGPHALDGRSVSDVLSAAVTRADQLGIVGTDRVLSTRSWDNADELVDGLVSILSVGASLVQVAGLDPTGLDRRVTSEKVTRTLL